MTDDDIDAVLSGWRQGDFALGGPDFLYRGAIGDDAADVIGEPIEETIEGIVVLTQTCDLVRSHRERPFVEVSPLASVAPDVARQARLGRRPAMATLDVLDGRDLIVDLDRVMTLEKRLLARLHRQPGPRDANEAVRFAAALARKRQRFAFPDDFVAQARGLVTRVQGKHEKASAEGRGLRALREIRVTALPGWRAERVELFFWFISLASHPVEGTQAFIDDWLDRFALGDRFEGIDGRWVSLDEMTAREYVDSVPLDLDHLSTRGG